MNTQQGIVICCYGSRGYSFMAFNLAYSIKHFCKDYPIVLFCEPGTISQLEEKDKAIFDKIIYFNPKDYTLNTMPDPATMKIKVLENSPFDETLYLDADTVCISDIKPLMEALNKDGRFFMMDIQGQGKKGDTIHYDAWSKHEYTFPFFDLAEDDIWYSTNSSWFYFKKGAELNELKGWMNHYLQKRYPLTELKNRWIKGKLPDELLWSGVISKLKIKADGFSPVFYGNTFDSAFDIKQRYQFISYYGSFGGGVNLVKPQWQDFLDMHMNQICKANGHAYKYKMNYCYQDKALNN